MNSPKPSDCRAIRSGSWSMPWAAGFRIEIRRGQLCTRGRRSVPCRDAPVRLVLDRQEEQLDSGNRPCDSAAPARSARGRDGLLTAISLWTHMGRQEPLLDAGVGNVAQAIYDCPNFASEQYDVFINAGPGCAMRGPGNTPGAFALEQAVDELAEKTRDRSAAAARPHRCEPRCGARSGARRRTDRLEPPSRPGGGSRVRSSAVSAWRNRSGAPTCRPMRHARCGYPARRLGRDAVQRAGHRHRHRHGAGAGRRGGAGPAPARHRVRIGDTDFRPGRRPTAAGPRPRSRRRRATRRIGCCATLFDYRGAHARCCVESLIARGGRIVTADNARGMSLREAARTCAPSRSAGVPAGADDYDGFRRDSDDMARLAMRWAESSSRKSPSTSRPASYGSSASSRRKIADARSTRGRWKARSRAACCRASPTRCSRSACRPAHRSRAQRRP